jgi:hypothetical protein
MSDEHIGRYRLIDEIDSVHPGTHLWFARDEILERPVSIRLLEESDPRMPAVLGAARAAALIDDRRLLRVLDVINIAPTAESPARVAVVSEWASGSSLAELITHKGPMDAQPALEIVADVAAGISAGLERHVSHGRLRPSSVLLTDAGEIRVRGLAVDAALFGSLPEDLPKEQGDVDGLGALLYFLTTGRWPGSPSIDLPPAPRNGTHVSPPSHVNGAVPRSVDDLVARSMHESARPRGVTNIPDATGFAAVARASAERPPSSAPRGRQSFAGGRLIAVVAAIGIVLGLGWLGLTLLSSSDSAWTDANLDDVAVIFDESMPETTPGEEVGDVPFAITRGRSFDPFGDDNDDGRPDRRRGRENNQDRGLAIDGNPATAWTTATYSSPDLDGKAGVGYIVDLGEPRSVSSITVLLTQPGADVQIKVSSEIFADPDLWTPFADIQVATEEVTVRSPRPLDGQYVLVWLTRLPADPNRSNSYQAGIADIIIRS